MKKWFLILPILFLCPSVALAQTAEPSNSGSVLSAKVIEIIEQNISSREDGSTAIQQKIKLEVLTGERKGQEIVYDGTQYDEMSANEYKVGDKVMVQSSPSSDGSDNFYILNIVRTPPLVWLAIIFAAIVVAVGGWKGVRALLVLALTFVVILKFILPQILIGRDPLTMSIVGSLMILVMAIYLTEGFKRTSTIAISSVIVTLLITGLLSVWFTELTRLTGFNSEESMFLIGLTDTVINIKGLLLAGMVIGALGVLDDVVVSQTAVVVGLKEANPQMSATALYWQAMRVGVSHLGSMVNTLFLAYAGAALPLLLLFTVHQEPFLTFGQVINNEVIAVEVVRALTGSIGIALAVPITTLLAVKFVRSE
ncbi:MAG: YibE/F family protein [Patescibacteria group bacterium]